MEKAKEEEPLLHIDAAPETLAILFWIPIICVTEKQSLFQALHTLDSGKHVQIIVFNNMPAKTILFLETGTKLLFLFLQGLFDVQLSIIL